jgi:predicted TIM-barrel fold metal-dependent hydrolase
MKRRDFLGGLLASTLLGGCDFSTEQGLFNECRNPGAGDLAGHPLVQAAWRGLRADRVWDVHVHLFGNGRGGKGVWVDPDFDHGWNPASRARRVFFMNGACVGSDENHVDQRMAARLAQLADQFPAGAKAMLLAFDFTYDDQGRKDEKRTTFSISDEYARAVARSRPDRFEWIASVHPYREDAVQALEKAKADGARAVKWLPPTMNIDLSNPRCAPAFAALARLDLPLLVHMGEEKAVPGAERDDLSNPLLLRKPLEAGVRVITAHCASLGQGADLDSRPGRGPDVPNLELFARLMGDRNYEGRLFGDISAITQANRKGTVRQILAHREWHARLLNGSDYPLPGVIPLFSLDALVAEGVLDRSAVPLLRELRQGNALLFDFVLKRCLSWNGVRFPAATFETRDFFEAKA